MLDGVANPTVLSYGFAALAFLAFGAHLAMGRPRGVIAFTLVATVGISAAWAVLGVGFAAVGGPALWNWQLVMDALRICALLFLALLVLTQRRPSVMLIVPLACLPLAAWVLTLDPPIGSAAALSNTRLPYAISLGTAIAGLVLAEQIFRRAGEQARWAIKPLCLGLGAAFAFDLYLFADALLFSRLDANVWAARGFAQALAIPFLAVATARNRDWTVDIALSRGVVFHSTALLACGVYLLTVAAAGYFVRFFGGSWGRTLQIGFIFAAMVLLGWLFASGTLRSKLRVFINKNFFSYRYDYREEWLRFTNLLASREPGVTSAQRSIEALANLVESPAGALWMRNGNGRYVQSARWNFTEAPVEQAEHSLAAFLQKTEWVVDLEEYRTERSRYAGLQLPEWILQLPAAWLIVPVIAHDELTGFVVLAAPRAKVELNWEVRDLLKTAARQVGSFLAQIQASEALLEARKFDAFNKMSSFVVHDLKNLVAQLSLMLKNAERHAQNPRFQQDMMTTVRHVTERMNKLMLQLSTGSRGEENVHAIHVDRLVERLVSAKRREGRIVGLDLDNADVLTMGYEQRLERVIGHLLQNAIDATAAGGEVRVRVASEPDAAVIEVIDTGCGMTEDFARRKLFRPFETTKPHGMGIGAYETAQYVQQMGGTITVDSRIGAGTTMRVMLPLHRVESPSSLPMNELA
jgi:putative PEP-CTERM system histidine kinase